MKNTAKFSGAAALVWNASVALMPALPTDERVDACVMALTRICPEDTAHNLGAAAVGRVAWPEEAA